MIGSVLRLSFVIAATALVAACSSGPSMAPSGPADPAAACLSYLNQHHIQYERVKDWRTPEGCGIDQAVRIKESAIPWNRPALMYCPFEENIWGFETQVVQPTAQRIFGRKVSKISHMGTYNCRGEKGSGHESRLSQHSYGKAIDIGSFELDDGTIISVLKDWRAPGPKSDFLHAVAKGACQHFNMVLTPNTNPMHRDHMHLDIGPYKRCSV